MYNFALFKYYLNISLFYYVWW